MSMNINKKAFKDAENENLYTLELYKNSTTGDIEYRTPKGVVIKVAGPAGIAALEASIANFVDGSSSFDTISELTAATGVTVDGVLLKDGLVNNKTVAVTTTGVSQTLAAGYNDIIFLTTTTGTDLAKISNSGISVGHQVSLIYVAEAAGADELVLSKLNAGDGIGFTTITFSTVGNTATLCWGGNAWFIVSVSGAVVA